MVEFASILSKKIQHATVRLATLVDFASSKTAMAYLAIYPVRMEDIVFLVEFISNKVHTRHAIAPTPLLEPSVKLKEQFHAGILFATMKQYAFERMYKTTLPTIIVTVAQLFLVVENEWRVSTASTRKLRPVIHQPMLKLACFVSTRDSARKKDYWDATAQKDIPGFRANFSLELYWQTRPLRQVLLGAILRPAVLRHSLALWSVVTTAFAEMV